ncbi:uroporphyrinogen decarboxylase family protein [Leadbettera azotonutricia]|uniref:Uroporphyrinogen-III decarboxylase n=1 Tax=Leadbettera azotonutricia (strain ATCC BAA-888 / DSM 13862 / ZAS-9) TaxID=545695 RepID=F5YCR3_LEAAZ|nr:uroporphyrinogen decarboxylase family protein [Leadbettera azotonutricia]AEF81782.1 uroporphyrinogen-III decarboxylase [Leadbettera azotonutricia ZAS-9]
MNKRDLVWRAFHNESVERIPVGFWFHFAKDELEDVFKNPGLREINIQGHKKFYEAFDPDFLKIMTDGYFCYPNEIFASAKDVSELKKIKPIGSDHPWIREQVKLAQAVTGAYGKNVLTFYNIFAPATIFKFARQGKNADSMLADFMLRDKAVVTRALNVVAEDTAALAKAVVSEGGADGIYYSTQDVSDSRISTELQKECIAPSDFAVLDSANSAKGLNILHICSYAGHHNKISHYTDYPVQIINWAAHLEKVSLGSGKKLFGGKPVIGGFDNTPAGVLYKGSKAEIEAETDRLINEAKNQGAVKGLALGADCTLPRDINVERLKWVRDRAAIKQHE